MKPPIRSRFGRRHPGPRRTLPVPLSAGVLLLAACWGIPATAQPAPDSTRSTPPPGAEILTSPEPAPGETPPFRIELFPEDHRDPPPGDHPDWTRHGDRRNDGDYRYQVSLGLGSEFLRYDRVEGLAFNGTVLEGKAPRGFYPSYRLGLGYAVAPQRGFYAIDVEQPVAPRRKVTLGAGGSRAYESFFYGDEIVTEGENSSSSLFLKRDYRDWYESEELRAWIGFYPSPFFRVRLGAVSREETSLVNRVSWSLFRQNARFRENPPIDNGSFRGWQATLVYDDHHDPSREGDHDDDHDARSRTRRGGITHYHRLTWERSEPSFDGDFDRWRAVADLRSYVRLTPRQTLALRVLGGAGESGAGPLPPQRRFFLGGVGTLRGQDFRSLTGDRVAMANLEYTFEIEGPSRAMVFVDSGTAWDRGSLLDQRVLVDVGAGVGFGDDGMTLSVARNLNDPDADVKFLVRFATAF